MDDDARRRTPATGSIRPLVLTALCCTGVAAGARLDRGYRIGDRDWVDRRAGGALASGGIEMIATVLCNVSFKFDACFLCKQSGLLDVFTHPIILVLIRCRPGNLKSV